MSQSKPTLKEQITAPPTRDAVIDECVVLVDEEVKSKKGVSGFAVRASYATVKALKKGFVRDVVDALLDDWLDQLEPYYQSWKNGTGTSFADYMTARSDDVADALLKVTDDRAARTKHKTAAKAYGKIRDSAKQHVSAAVPKLSKLMEQHLQTGTGASATV